MRILYNNLLEDATLAATNEDSNYPIEEVVDGTLLTEFRADTNSSVITATLASASTVSCFAFGNHNIDTLSIKLTDSIAGTTTYNYTAGDLKFSDTVTQAMVYESAVSDIVEIEYTITSNTTLYIGGLSAGQCLQFPYFDATPRIGFRSTGSRQKSRGGVSYNVPGKVLETFNCVFNGMSITDYNAINAFFQAVQVYKPHFLDRWEDSTEFPVLFAQNTKDIKYDKGLEGIIFDSLRLEFEECK